jgi:hypothetical protein
VPEMTLMAVPGGRVGCVQGTRRYDVFVVGTFHFAILPAGSRSEVWVRSMLLGWSSEREVYNRL